MRNMIIMRAFLPQRLRWATTFERRGPLRLGFRHPHRCPVVPDQAVRVPQYGRDFGRFVPERCHEDERKHGDRDVIFRAWSVGGDIGRNNARRINSYGTI